MRILNFEISKDLSLFIEKFKDVFFLLNWLNVDNSKSKFFKYLVKTIVIVKYMKLFKSCKRHFNQFN